MAPGPKPPGVDLKADGDWQNYGQNQRVPSVQRQYFVWNDPGDKSSVWTAGLANLQWVVQTAEANNYRLRPGGQTWSFSACVATADTIVDTRALSMTMPDLAPADLAPGATTLDGAPLTADRLAHVQAGKVIDKLNTLLESSRRCVWTIGGNAGQTIGGAIATGTHGAFWRRPPIGDYVRALTLVAEGGRAIWLEPTRALTSDAFTGCDRVFEVVRDDDLFQAALISLGSIGIVFSVVLEVRPLVFLDYQRASRDFDLAVENALYDWDLSGLGLAGTPEHFEITLDPYKLGAGQRGAHVTTVFEVDPATPQLVPADGPPIDAAHIAELLRAIAADPREVPALTSFVMDQIYADRHAVGPFTVTTPVSKTANVATLSTEIAFARDDAKVVIPFVLDAIRAAQPRFFLPGVLGIRFTGGGSSLLAFARYPDTCTIEFACMGGVAGTEQFLDGLLASLTRRGVDFRVHWGQFFTPAAEYADRYGDARTRWQAARGRLLPNRADVWGNAFTDALGLT